MLAVVKTPHIEMSLHGEHVAELLDWIRQRYEVTVLVEDEAADLVPIESTEFWKRMEKNRIGNLLAAARLKSGLTQAQLAEKIGIRQGMVSDYERGRRTFSASMARRFARALKVREEHLTYRFERKNSVD